MTFSIWGPLFNDFYFYNYFFFFRDLELVELHASKDGGCDMRITANSTGSTGDDVSNFLQYSKVVTDRTFGSAELFGRTSTVRFSPNDFFLYYTLHFS